MIFNEESCCYQCSLSLNRSGAFYFQTLFVPYTLSNKLTCSYSEEDRSGIKQSPEIRFVVQNDVTLLLLFDVDSDQQLSCWGFGTVYSVGALKQSWTFLALGCSAYGLIYGDATCYHRSVEWIQLYSSYSSAIWRQQWQLLLDSTLLGY